jgi:hypothetical protein
MLSGNEYGRAMFNIEIKILSSCDSKAYEAPVAPKLQPLQF